MKEIRVSIKNGKIDEDSLFKEEEKEPIEEEDSKINKVLKICQRLAKDMKNIIAMNGDSYGIEWSHLYVYINNFCSYLDHF